MTFRNEKEALDQLAETVLKAGANLFKASKYLYVLTTEHYFNCSIKDFIKVLLNNMYNADALGVFRISIDGPACANLNTREYFAILRHMIHSFAVRLPILCRVNVHGQSLTDKQIETIYKIVLEKGFSNEPVTTGESFHDILKAVKKGKGREDLPYRPEWYREYVYSAVPSLTDLSNPHLLFLGTMDVLLTLYYLCLENDFEKRIQALCLDASRSE
jgi:hypothetical protein